jgi:acetolactate synthase-1/2/3 large subunit
MPLLAVGLGAVQARVQDDIRALAEKHNIPVALTPMAKGMLAEDHRCYAGIVFHALSDMVGETHQQADLVVGIGYDPVEFNYESWMPKAPLISLDIEPADIDRTYTVAVDAVGDIKSSLAALLSVAPGKNDWDLNALAERKVAMFKKLQASSIAFGPKAALTVLREVLPQDGIMTCDVGAHTHLIGQLWRTPAPGLQLANGWSTMGWHSPPSPRSWSIRGNTSARSWRRRHLMTAGELATALRCNAKIVVALD